MRKIERWHWRQNGPLEPRLSSTKQIKAGARLHFHDCFSECMSHHRSPNSLKKKKTLPKLAHQTRARKPRVTGFLARLGRSQTTSHRRSTLRPGGAHCTVSSMSSSIRSETTSSVTASTGRDGTVTAVLNAGDGGGFFVRTSRFFDLGRGRNLVEAKRASESTIHIDLFTKLRKGSVYRLYTGSR